MKVTLLHHTPLEIGDYAIGKCWDKTTDKPDARMFRVANKYKHASTIEHITYNFDIDGISRACLQELARHRMQNMSVKSSRYTLGELKDEESFWFDFPADCPWELGKKYLVMTGDIILDSQNIYKLHEIQTHLRDNKSNDIVKYAIPEAYKTSLVSTMNMRALQNFLSLRTDKAALKEIQELAHNMFEVLPEDHKFMLVNFVKHYNEKGELVNDN